MIQETLREVFKRDLGKLRMEIEQYTKEENLWKTDKNIANSGGNLYLHLVGNLNAFIGAALGKSGYVRNREAEFGLKNVPKKELLEKIDALLPIVDSTLANLSPDALRQDFPILVFKEKTTTEFFLVHLATHLSYHLGQINYHRRLMDI